jgi:hypothetical protein
LRATCADLAGSIGEVLSVGFIGPAELFSGAGGFAAAIAVGAFIGQIPPSFVRSSDLARRRYTVVGGLFGLAPMIGLILLSANRW